MAQTIASDQVGSYRGGSAADMLLRQGIGPGGFSCCRRSSSSSAIRSARSSAFSGSASPTTSSSYRRAGELGLASTTTSQALQRPADVGEPVAGDPVHDHVPAGNDHPAAAPGHPRRPGEQPASRHGLPRHPAHSGRDSEHARLRAVEVDVQLPGRPDQSFPGRCHSACSRCRTRRNGWAARR